MPAGDRVPGETLECRKCHRIGYRGYVPYGSEYWTCGDDRACTIRAARRTAEDTELRMWSLWQPWAWLVAYGGKDVENRGIPYRWPGPVGIHSAQRIDRYAYDHPMVIAAINRWIGTGTVHGVPPWEQSGQVLAVCRINLGTVHHSRDCRTGCSQWAVDGQYHHPLTDVVPIEPIGGVRGRQRLWTPTPELSGRTWAAVQVASLRGADSF